MPLSQTLSKEIVTQISKNRGESVLVMRATIAAEASDFQSHLTQESSAYCCGRASHGIQHSTEGTALSSQTDCKHDFGGGYSFCTLSLASVHVLSLNLQTFQGFFDQTNITLIKCKPSRGTFFCLQLRTLKHQ